MRGLLDLMGGAGPAVAHPLAASAATAARPGGFDPASTLAWSVPLLLLGPVFAFIVVVMGVRARRAASNVTLFAVVIELLAVLLVGWARLRQAAPYRVAFQWINIPVSFTGDQRFQGFGIDLAVRTDRYALAALIAVLVVFLSCLVWHRLAAVREPGPVRYHVNALLLLIAATGALLSTDLAELLAFWTLAGLSSYFLLGHRWGSEAAARASRVALALPFLADMALLSGVGVLYSRFGTLDLGTLFPMLHTTLGVGLKSVTLAALLIWGAVFVRACLWPFTAWQTGPVEAPPSLLALVSAVWPILAGSLLLRTLPLIGGAGVQAPRAASYSLAVAAVVAPLLGLVGTELRRSLLLASSGGVALALLCILFPASTAAGFTGLLAVSLGRCGALLSGSAAAGAMRTLDLRQTGAASRIMRWTAAGLLVSVAAFSLGPAAAAAWRPRSLAWLALGPGMFLVALAGFRVVFAVSAGPLRRRRAFEPDRVREVPLGVAVSALVAGTTGLVAAALAFFTGWIGYLSPERHANPGVGTYVLWVVVVLLATVVAFGAFAVRKDRFLALAGLLGDRFGTAWAIGGVVLGRYLSRPGLEAINTVEGMALPAAESGVGRAALSVGGLAGRPLPWLAVAAAAALVLAIVFALATPGVRP